MKYDIGDYVFESWKITRIIGEGSYGKVMEIERNEFGLNIQSALKVISIPQTESEVRMIAGEGLDDKSVTSYFYGFVEEIIKEIAIMSELKGNTNIVAYEDHKVIPHEGSIGWDILIRMELLTPLTDYIASHKITEKTVAKLGCDILRALELCWKRNVVHRDIKPENIFVSSDGDFKLGDFGIARTVEKTTLGLSKKGTYSYMAPEIYEGKDSNYTVDMYSLALVMYKLLNQGRMPFFPEYPRIITYTDRENALYKRMQGDKILRPYYGSKELIRVILKAADYDPKERYSSATEMRQALEKIACDDRKALNEVKSQVSENMVQGVEEPDKTVGLFTQNSVKQPECVHKKEVEHASVSPEAILDVLQEEKKEKTGKRKIIIISICLLFLILTIFLICLWINRKTEVPDFSGMSYQQASDVASKYKVTLSTEKDFSDQVEKGKVCGQDIAAEQEVKVKETIHLTISKGKEMVTVPDFVGKTKEEVEGIAKKGRVKIQFAKENSDTVEKGRVISQSEQYGESVAVNSKIKVTISIGVQQVEIPDFKNMTLNEAITRCNDLKIQYTTFQEYNNDIAQGCVIDQNIAVGSMVDVGSTINFNISMGADINQSLGDSTGIPNHQIQETTQEVRQEAAAVQPVQEPEQVQVPVQETVPEPEPEVNIPDTPSEPTEEEFVDQDTGWED